MVHVTNVYESLNISIGTIMKNPEMLKLVPDSRETKKMCKHAVKKFPYLLRYDVRLHKCLIK